MNADVQNLISMLLLFAVLGIFTMIVFGQRNLRIFGGIAMAIGVLIGIKFGFGGISNPIMITGFISYLFGGGKINRI